MTRVMIDSTHLGLPAALSTIRSLKTGDVVALYDTGSGEIAATPADIAEIPPSLTTIFIDQGFTGSPNMHATVRDCENGAWSLTNAVNKTGWNVKRPTLYLGFPDTVAQAYQAGWRGDVWLVHPSTTPPLSPPPVPPGINVVAQQWNFSNSNFDASVIFDPTWPGATVTTPPVPPTDPPAVPAPTIQQHWAWCFKCQSLFYAPNVAQSTCPTDGLRHDGSKSFNYILPALT